MASAGRGTTGSLTSTLKDQDAVKIVAAALKAEGAAAPIAWPKGSVVERLFLEPFNFDFYQAVRLLQAIDTKRSPVGLVAAPKEEAVRFRVHTSLNFPPSTIADLKPARGERPPELTEAFLGLTGPSGVLPRHYTEMLLRLERDTRHAEQHAMRDWFDMFNHRVVSLFYRAWEKYRFYMSFERREAFQLDPDNFTKSLLSLVGLGMPPLRNRLRVAIHEQSAGKPKERVLARVEDLTLLYFGGLLAHRPRSAVGLAGILQEYFTVPVKVKQFHGQWLRLDRENQSRLGAVNGNTEVGLNLVIGERVWDVQGKIRLLVGPLNFEQLQQFMPDRTPMPQRKAFFELVHLCRLYVGAELDFDVQLIVNAPDVPECQLPEGTADGPQLGWNSWIASQSFAEDAGDAVFEGEEVVFLDE